MIKNIIPTPKNVKALGGEASVELSVLCTEDSFLKYTDTLKAAFKKLFKITLSDGAGGILIQRDGTLPNNAYRYDTSDGIILSASSEEGILYAMATLIQTATVKNGRLTVSKAVIDDYPEKEFRCLMVDLAREWHPAHTVHQYIDLCFILKVKYLHLHFIDNERFTLPSRAFPLLCGEESYTYEEIKAMRDYASSRGIILIPEIEAPGHAARLTACYPEIFANTLDCAAEEEKTESGAVIDDSSIICAGKESAALGIRTLLAEACELFPDSPYIHIGGDEAKINAWNYCSHCLEYMNKNGIEDVYELYSEFVGRVARDVIDMGRTPIVWEGFPKKGIQYIPRETVVIAWETMYHMPYDLIEEGFKVINSSWLPLYVVPNPSPRFNWGISEILGWNVYNWQHWYTHSEAHLNPINVAPTDQVIGATLCLWECTFEEEIYRGIKNLSAMSERVWTVKRLWTDEEYINRAYPTIRRISRLIQNV